MPQEVCANIAMPKPMQAPESSASAASHKEIEIKLRVNDVAAFRRKLKKLNARVLPREVASKDGRVHELNTLYDTPQGGFARHGQLLRMRVESPGGGAASASAKKSANKSTAGKRSAASTRTILTYKGPAESASATPTAPHANSRHKTREEIEARISDSADMDRVLHALGLRGWFRYEKFRTTYQLPAKMAWAKELLIELDETPIGTFVELEGPADSIDRAARELGYGRHDYITKSYLALHIESCQRQGRNIPQLAPGIVAGIPDMVFSQEKKSR
jgi:adenylate cyclase, class 2